VFAFASVFESGTSTRIRIIADGNMLNIIAVVCLSAMAIALLHDLDCEIRH